MEAHFSCSRNHTLNHTPTTPKQNPSLDPGPDPTAFDTIPTLPRLAYVLPAWIRGPALHPHEAHPGHPTSNSPASAAGRPESLGACLRMPSITALLINPSTQ